MNPKTRLIQLINIAKSQLKLDEDVYRAMLKAATKKDSLRAMNLGELEQALEAFKQKGFKPKAKASAKGKRMSPSSKKANPRNKEISKIRAIWITMHKQGFVRDGSETALDRYVKRLTTAMEGGAVDSVAWLKPKQSYPILESLKSWHRRVMLETLKEAGAFITYKDAIQMLSPEGVVISEGGEKPAGYDQIVKDYSNYLENKKEG